MQRYEDMMDTGRIVVPQNTNGSKYVCSVFWKGPGGSLHYGGTVELSVSLFADSSVKKSIGFRAIQ